MVSVGDLVPLEDTFWTIEKYLGDNYLWYPVVGNHDLWESDMQWLRSYDYDPNGDAPPNIVNRGPQGCLETTYSFDYGNSHFVVLNIYCDTNRQTDGAIVDALYDWLVADLNATDKQHIFVFGHEPAFPQEDFDIGLVRHLGDSLDKYPVTRDRFWSLLRDRGVAAYVNGHTHSFSAVEIDGVCQVDVGHAMGARTQAAQSTFVVFHVEGNTVRYEAYRADSDGIYSIRYSGILVE